MVAPSFSFFYLPNDWPPFPPTLLSHSEAMNYPADGRHTYPSSSQDGHYHHRPNPALTQAMVGPHQRITASNARRIEYVPGGYVSCGAGMFANRTVRAEVKEIQKANVGRKYVLVFTRHEWPLNLDRFPTDLLRRYAASKDRRALDPPPVTELHIYDIEDAGDGTTRETEVDYR